MADKNKINQHFRSSPNRQPTTAAKQIEEGANKLGSWFLQGLGAVGRFMTAGFTSPTYGTNGQVSYARNIQDARRQRQLAEAQEQALAKGATYIMPANYIVGKGNPVKGEEKISQMQPWQQAAIRGAELYFGPKVVKGMKNSPKVIKNFKKTSPKIELTVEEAAPKRFTSREQLGEYLGDGSEQTVYDAGDGYVHKVYEEAVLPTRKDLQKFIRGYMERNEIPLQEPVEYVGYFKQPRIGLPSQQVYYPVFRQKKLQPVNMDWKEFETKIGDWLRKNGYNDNVEEGVFTNGKHTLIDIQPENTGYSNGQFRFFDVGIEKPTDVLKLNEKGFPFSEESTTINNVQNFIDNDIIPRLKKQGHKIDSYTPNIRSANFKEDLMDQKMQYENGGAWFEPATNNVTLRGPLENQDYGLVIHEAGGHGIRYNMQSNYKPVTREQVNTYLADPENPVTQEPLLKAHIGNEVFNEFESNTLNDAYPEVTNYFNNFTNRLSGQKLSDSAKANRIKHEQGAINTQFRAKLSENGKLTGQALDKKIMETPEGVILRMEIEQGYTSIGVLERLSKITGISIDELNFYNPNSLQQLANKFPQIKTMVDKVKYAMTNVGGYTFPVVGGGYTLYNLLNNQNNNQQLEYRKQGGKMNLIDFLKKGSGIHIKKENRGKFTSYCGGTVTDECIRKAKASGNPTLVKRATFADNARHFKHRFGGSIVEAFKLRRQILNSLNNMIND